MVPGGAFAGWHHRQAFRYKQAFSEECLFAIDIQRSDEKTARFCFDTRIGRLTRRVGTEGLHSMRRVS
jgi:hypothetical protein